MNKNYRTALTAVAAMAFVVFIASMKTGSSPDVNDWDAFSKENKCVRSDITKDGDPVFTANHALKKLNTPVQMVRFIFEMSRKKAAECGLIVIKQQALIPAL
jgi:hypothetical protein